MVLKIKMIEDISVKKTYPQIYIPAQKVILQQSCIAQYGSIFKAKVILTKNIIYWVS